MKRVLALSIALALAGAVAPAPAQADAAALPAGITTQLPREVRPTHYEIRVEPHAESLTFDGSVRISVEVLQPTRQIVLNAADLEFAGARLVDARGRAREAGVAVDAEAQTASFAFGRALRPGRYVLELDYRGRIGTQANGLFALDYPTVEGRKRALYTQFENSDARRFVPSWDEPAHKATFDLTVVAPAGQTVVGNMPVAQERDLPGGRREVRFHRTPRMSTYLLFLGMGEFDRVTVTGDNGTEIGVLTQKGKVEQARFALEASRDILREYNEYFGVPYPLPKLDNIAAPGRSQFFSAMENWGAIFTFERALLLDPAISNTSDRQAVFEIAAHEIAHQWFGNLVTMAWWDDLWLNEGFATWMEGHITRKLHPEWDPDDVRAVYTSRGAMDRDAYATTHPVVQHVETVEQASQAFDGITYGKGAAVISMLEDYVGAEAWRQGVRSYIARHAYGNAVTDALWREIDQAAAGKEFLQVAHDFTLQPGVPLIRAAVRCEDGRGVLALGQGEYSIDRPDKEPLRWRVPVKVRAADGSEQRVLVDGRAEVALPGCEGPVVVNAGQKGYFRTLYAPEQFQALGRAFTRLPVVDQLGVLMDANALAAVGLQPEGDVLDLVAQVPLEASADLWLQLSDILGGLDELYGDEAAGQDRFRRFAVARLSPKLAQLGWEDRDGDSATTRRLRAALFGTLSRLGDPRVIAEARRRFEAFLRDPESLPVELRRPVLGIVARHADAATWERLRAMAQAETSSLLREQYYTLLGTATDRALAQRALALALTDEPGATTSAGMIGAVARNHPHLAFDFAVAHKAQVDTLVDSTSNARYYPYLGAAANDLAMVDKIRAFAEQHVAPTSRRDAETAMVGIQTRVKLRQRRLPQIDAWLRRHGL